MKLMVGEFMNKKMPLWFKSVWLIVSLALLAGCELRNSGDISPEPVGDEAVPASLGPLPAALVEAAPMPGSVLGISSEITLYFNQAMDQASVEAGLQFSPEISGSFTWADGATVSFNPQGGWPLATEINLTLPSSLQSEDGQAFQEEVNLVFRTADYLNVVERLPLGDSAEVDPTAAIVASFNYPVVPLGGNPEELPAAFVLSPAADGHGEWINTSTYIFYPDPGLFGGQQYSLMLDPELRSVEGTPLEEQGAWAFTTAEPELVFYSPGANERQVRLDQPVELNFNQPMDTASLEDGFRVTQEGGSTVAGTIEWDEAGTVMTFTPDELYQRSGRYSVNIPADAKSKGGSMLTENVGSYTFFAADDLFVLSTDPESGGLKDYYQSVVINFNAPLSTENLDDLVSVSPAVNESVSVVDGTLYVYGYFVPEEAYTVTVGANATDIWGGRLGQVYELKFRGAPLDTDFRVSTYTGAGVMFVNPAKPGIAVQVVNVDQVGVEIGNLSLEDFVYLDGAADYETRQNYRPVDVSSRWQILDILPNRNQEVGVPLNAAASLTPGLYWVRLTPNPAPTYSLPQQFFAVVSHVQMVYKIGIKDALVWAVDTRSGSPVANAPVMLYAHDGALLASGLTGEDGIFYTEIDNPDTLYSNSYAVLYTPGDELFSLATTAWNWGISAWDFGYRSDYSPAGEMYYIYTDRPIYRPGQMVQYRVVARSAFNGRYQLPKADSVLLSVRDFSGAELAGYTLPLSEYGTASGVYYLSEEARPGFYELMVGELEGDHSYLTFQVAEYRKPEIDMQVGFNQDEVLAGESLDAEVLAEYFFDAPVSSISAAWNLYVDDTYFSLPGYRVGPLSDWTYDPWDFVPGGLGTFREGGVGTTDESGVFEVNLNTEETSNTQNYTLEITITDESGMPVSSRASTTVHPAPYYIGVKSDTWMGQIDEELGLEVYVVGWDRQPAGVQNLEVDFGKVSWERGSADPYGFYTFEKVVTPLSAGAFDTNAEGKARLSFIPDEPGVYQVEVHNGKALTQMLIWVGGPGQAVWPNLTENQLNLIPDAETYTVGKTAKIFIPNPFVGDAQALITTERGLVLSQEVLTISGSGTTYSVNLEKDSAPNVYVSVSMVGETENGTLDYYYGLTNLDVEPEEQILNVEVLGDPERAAPGDRVVFTIRVSDKDDNPVQGEFSLSVVDEAVLALTDPYEQDIASFFYDRQPLGLRTGISLLATSEDFLPNAGGLGGGGGDAAMPNSRTEFEDTAYWNASVVTGADGTTEVEVVLPDNLTTWRVLVRGVTVDTRVGEALSEVVTTKELFIRPVVPRFAVAGDHLRIGAVVHNNTGSAIDVGMAFQITGMQLDDPDSALQEFEIPANGRTQVEFWGVVEDVSEIEAIFTVEGGGYSDITTPASGAIPVLNYLAPQSLTTAGVMADGGERLEVISLPQSFDPSSGGLKLELSPSLAAVTLQGLQALERSYPSESIEYTISRFLPNVEILRALREFDLASPELEDQLGAELGDILKQLEEAQNYDGGWGWNYSTNSSDSHPFVSAYALLALVRAQEIGFSIPENREDRVEQYLIQYLVENEINDNELWKYDRFAFIHFVLVEADSPVVDLMFNLMEDSDKLSPWAQALLSLAVDKVDPGNQKAASIFSNLQANAIRSASGAHWDDPGRSWQNMSSDTFTNAVVIFTLARRDPSSPLLTDAVRYLMAYRDAEGGWSSSYTTAWALIALTEVMRGTGELGGEFSFSAMLNEQAFVEGAAGGTAQFVPVNAEAGIDSLLPDSPNALNISRDPGIGRLYYRASLQVAQPVEDVQPLNRGLSITRAYYPGGKTCPNWDCDPINSAQVGDLVTVRVTLTLPNSMHYLHVEDYIPAGTEVLNTNLKTSQLGGDYEYYETPLFDPRDPFAAGWGWWYFGDIVVHDEHVSWNAEFLPEGTYQLTYTLVVLQPGDFQVIPAQAYQLYFPEVQGTSAGEVFEVRP